MTWREVVASDLATCLEMEPSCIGDELVGRRLALRAWNDLLLSPSFIGAVIEGDRPIGGHHIVACGLGVFVAKEFADREVQRPMPGLNSRIIAGILSGQRVVLSYNELGRGNACGGLDFINMYGTWRH